MLFVAVDIGGTFTDLIGLDDVAGRLYSAKRLTTPDNLVRGVLNCIDRSGLALGEVTLNATWICPPIRSATAGAAPR